MAKNTKESAKKRYAYEEARKKALEEYLKDHPRGEPQTAKYKGMGDGRFYEAFQEKKKPKSGR